MARQDKIALAGVIGTYLAVISGVITPEIRNFFNSEEMTMKQILSFITFVTVCASIWQFGIWKFVRNDTDFVFVDKVEEDKKGKKLRFGNMQLFVEPHGEVTLKAVVNSFSNGIRRPIKKLEISDFLIIEEYRQKRKRAKIMEVKPIDSSLRMILLIDISESMWGETKIKKKNNYLRKIEVVKESILEFVTRLVKSDLANINDEISYIAFLPFSSNGVHFLNNSVGDIWFKCSSDSLDEINENIELLKPDGMTPMFDAIDYAIDRIASIRENRYKLLLSLTDGIENNSNSMIEELLFKLKSKNIPIITIGYGLDGEVDTSILKQISLTSGAGGENIGSFTNLSTMHLSTLLNLIGTDLNNAYEIRWKSAFPNPGNHIVTRIQATYIPISGEMHTPVVEKEYMVPISK
ncbi:hypothetical protein GMMP13_100036 [Candidatus Magnetomoraceae bacterium gMMP-13]